MATANITFSPGDALLHLENIQQQLDSIRAVAATAAASMYQDEDRKNSTERILFSHIRDLASDAKSRYALEDMLNGIKTV